MIFADKDKSQVSNEGFEEVAEVDEVLSHLDIACTSASKLVLLCLLATVLERVVIFTERWATFRKSISVAGLEFLAPFTLV